MNKDATPERLLALGSWSCTKRVASILGVTQQAISMASTRLEARGLCRLYETKRVPGRCGRPFRVFVAIPKRQ